MKTLNINMATAGAKAYILLIIALLFISLAGAQSVGMRLIGYGKYDYAAGDWHNVDSLKQEWLGNFGGDEDHYNGDTWNLTYRESINSNYSTINYASKSYNTFNEAIQMVSTVHLEWDGAAFTNSSRTTNTYNAHGQKTDYLQQAWVAGAWVNSSQTFDSLDENGRVVSEESKQWNTATNTWKPAQIIINQYTASGKRILYESKYWNGSIYINQDRVENVYDDNDQLLTSTIAAGSGLTWVNGSRLSYQYDRNNNNTIYSRFVWQTTTGTWKNDRRDLFTYNSSNLRTEWVEQTWGTSWDNAFKYTFMYNSANLKEVSTRQNWSGSTRDNYRNYISLYNANGFEIQNKSQSWDAGAWVDATNTTYTRNTADQKTMIREETYASGAWSTKSEKYYYYEDYAPTGVPEVVNSSLRTNAFPNPFTVNTSLEFEQKQNGSTAISIYNLRGELIRQQNNYYPGGTHNWLWDGNDTNGQTVNPGVYFISIESAGVKGMQKLVKL